MTTTDRLSPFKALLPLLFLGIPSLPAAPLQPVLFSGMGSHHWKITTDSPEAQKWFNQGINWYYAFNFDEAQIAFRKAAEVDPDCAMAWWGLSEAAGPQYNHPVMDEQRIATAREAMAKALAQLHKASPMEQGLIKALKHRNALEKWDGDKQTEQNKKYAAALGEVWKGFPKHPNYADVGALYALSLIHI